MSGLETVELDARNRLCIEVRIEDPVSGNSFSIECDIDTGNPDAIALPQDYEGRLTRHLGTEARSGAGIGESDIYAAEITGIGQIKTAHTTSVYFSLPRSMPTGLIGMDLLKYMISEIYDGPDNTKMDLKPTHL